MVRGGEGQMPWVETAEPATAAMKWLNDNERMIKFDWPGWDEGRQIFRNWSPATAPSLDHATVCKLLTAVARNDRFNDGAWANLFESGTAQPLLTRLLELEEQLANRH